MKKKETVEDLVISSNLLLELRACLVDRYIIYSKRDDKEGVIAIASLYRQLFGKGMFDKE